MSSVKQAQKILGKMSLILAMSLSSGCLVPEAGPVKEEVVGTPTSTPADFTVTSTDAPAPNPGDSNPTPPALPPAPENGPSFNFDLIVNNGVKLTTSESVDLTFIAPPWFAAIKVGSSNDCSDGTWIPWVDRGTKLLAQNTNNLISVQYRDYDYALSPCLLRTIKHDNKGPEIIISQYPLNSLEEGNGTDLIYSVTDASQVVNTVCSLNNIEKVCAAGSQNKVTITQMPAGDYSFQITAVDELGNKSSALVHWSVVNSTRSLTQTIDVKDDRKVDILFVIDNSGSMGYEQRSMANRVGRMLKVLSGLNWQIAVTTTDPTPENYVPGTRNSIPGTQNGGSYSTGLSDGRLIPIYGSNGQYILDTTTSIETAQYRLGMTLQRPEVGSGSEQGIFATYRFIERSQSTNPEYRNFFRDGANLAVVIISDEDESANGLKNDPQNLVNLVSTTFQQQKVFTWHSIITKPGDSECKNTYGATYGDRLARFSVLTGGLIGSVCETDYATQVEGIANGIKNMNKSLGLTCEPLPQFPITVKKDGQPYIQEYTKEGLNLKFKEVLGPGRYTLEYRCLK